MAETDLTIVLKVMDNATAEIKKGMSEVRTATRDVETATKEAGKTIKEQFKEASRTLRDFRRTLFIVTAAFAAVIASTREAAKFNEEAAATYNKFTIAVQSLSVALGQICAPAIQFVTFLLNALRNALEAVVAGFIKAFTFITEFFSNITAGPIEAFRIAMEQANAATDEFLNKIELTRAKVAAGMSLEKQREQIATLEKIHIKATKNIQAGWEATKDAIDLLGTSLAGAEELGRGFAKTAAGIALAMAVINTAEGVTRALKDYPWPFSMVVAGLIAAAGAVQVATIAATKFHQGGLIRAHNGLAVDEVPIIAQRGEGILSKRGMTALGGSNILNRLNAGVAEAIPITINMENVSFRSEDDIEDVMIRLSNLISAKTRSKI